MTKKDLFKIILKLYGLYSIIEVAVQIPNLTYYLFYDSGPGFNWLMLTAPVVGLFIVYILFIRPEIIIDLFKLDYAVFPWPGLSIGYTFK